MRNQPHPEFLHRVRTHNWAVFLTSIFSGAAAAIVWGGLYFGGKWAVLSFRTTINGTEAILPADYDLWFGGFFFAVIATVLAWRWWRPLAPPCDRPIIGWHLIPEILLLPGYLLLAFSDQWIAWQHLTPARLHTSWELLRAFATQPKWPEPHLPRLGLNEKELPRSLLLLQYVGLIDLHRSPRYWFYRLRSSEEDTVQRWMHEFTP